MQTYGLTDLGYSIFLDRYSHKDPHAAQNVKEGDTVLVVKDNKRIIATVETLYTDTALVYYPLTEQREEVSRSHLDLPLELDPKQMLDRVARGAADTPEQEENFRWLLDDWKFVPAGRILTAMGTDQDLSYFNCYVVRSPHDSRGGILDTLREMTELMSRGGGVGINLSTLRPKHAYVRGVNGRSSGAVSWGGLYSYSTGLIEQAGSRRGALILILDIWHPDVFDFINAKREAGKITNANISVNVSDKFMGVLKQDGDWTLEFPDTDHPTYNQEWNGDLDAWKAKGYPVRVYKTVKASALWNAMIESAWASAEPGVWFGERANKFSNSQYYDEGRLIATNPCGEISLPANGVCNLGALNLSKFVVNGAVDWACLAAVVQYAVEFLDNAIDKAHYYFEEQRIQQQSERRVGLGSMGLAEMMIACGVRYGSLEGVEFVDTLYRFIAKNAYRASIRLARLKGSFVQFDASKFMQSEYMQGMDDETLDLIHQYGIRNVTLLTVQPTGTIGTMMNTSTGLEPYFAFEWERTSRLGTHTEYARPYQQWREQHPGETKPDYFVTAMDLAPEEHVRMQAAIQRWVDASLSKTTNCPADYTIAQTDTLYRLMYDMGCKGGTIYRDQSRSEQVLNLVTTPSEERCPEEDCDGIMLHQDGCPVCQACGYSACAV